MFKEYEGIIIPPCFLGGVDSGSLDSLQPWQNVSCMRSEFHWTGGHDGIISINEGTPLAGWYILKNLPKWMIWGTRFWKTLMP